MPKIILLCLGLALIVTLTGCAPGPNLLKNTPDGDASIAGFWHGLWQGFIAPFAFLVSLFSDSVTIYEHPKNLIFVTNRRQAKILHFGASAWEPLNIPCKLTVRLDSGSAEA